MVFIGNDLINLSSGNVRRMIFYVWLYKKLRLFKFSFYFFEKDFKFFFDEVFNW